MIAGASSRVIGMTIRSTMTWRARLIRDRRRTLSQGYTGSMARSHHEGCLNLRVESHARNTCTITSHHTLHWHRRTHTCCRAYPLEGRHAESGSAGTPRYKRRSVSYQTIPSRGAAVGGAAHFAEADRGRLLPLPPSSTAISVAPQTLSCCRRGQGGRPAVTQVELSDTHTAAIATEISRHMAQRLGKQGGEHG